MIIFKYDNHYACKISESPCSIIANVEHLWNLPHAVPSAILLPL